MVLSPAPDMPDVTVVGTPAVKITGVRTVPVDLPLAEPFRTAIHDIRSIGCLLVFVETDQGLVGESYLWLSSARRLKVLDTMVASLADLVVGRNPEDVRSIWQDMWDAVELLDRRGVTMFAISALEVACWDLVGKSRDLSVSRLFGRVRDRIPVYADGGLFTTMSIPELVAQAEGFVEKGFRAMKMRLGPPTLAETVERVAAIRAAIGPDVALMADANQGLSLVEALRLGRGLEPYRLDWFEEPIPAHDLDGAARLAAALDTPIALGQSVYNRYGFAEVVGRRAAGVLMPDLQRIGGVCEFIKVAHMAETMDIPITPHLFTEQSLQLAAILPNCCYAERMSWFDPLYAELPEMVDGCLVIPDRPGLGVPFDEQAVARFRAA
ncbi:MAG: mandelate racemase/muconate lactonizing enzyme family protein [Alphaproteobacteria bacterium]|jgi:L-alanine-DL-glutamate epimerase-like enolase superfamily enzyme|nr:mandelate racemase/muconate lactonizing enzyme family protein [Alphaproteobacteria bacterium]MDP6515182.1 mandelate racemase/muconate lactonizing enzyme family protein [Alphaproteobacteria bacterium]